MNIQLSYALPEMFSFRKPFHTSPRSPKSDLLPLLLVMSGHGLKPPENQSNSLFANVSSTLGKLIDHI